MSDWCCALLLLIVAAWAYFDGYVPYTEPYWVRHVETYYWAALRARTCVDLVAAMDSVSKETLEYMQHHADLLDANYPREPLQQHVVSLRCVDKDGDAIAF